MPSLFPSLLSYGEVSPLLIRIILGVVFVYWAYKIIARSKGQLTARSVSIATIEGIAGTLIVIGLWTQGAALVLVIDLIVRLIHKAINKSFLTDGVNYNLILLVLAISLLLTGAGNLAFDLPL